MKTTPDLSAMWAALEKYQPYADADGHGETWRRMCSERTEEAAAAAVEAESAAYWSELAIKRIERAIKDREPELSSPAPVSNDDGQPQTVDKPEPFDLNEAFRHTPQRQPLTEEEVIALLPDAVRLPQGWRDFARAIEAAHGIGGDK
jgi:hypothetical protein